MYLSAAPWTAPCGPTDWSSLFQGQRGTQRSLAGLRQEPGHREGLGRWVSRWARRLSCPWSALRKSLSLATPRVERQREGDRKWNTDTGMYSETGRHRDFIRQTIRKADCTLVLIFLAHLVTTVLFTFTPNRAVKGGKRFRANLHPAT